MRAIVSIWKYFIIISYAFILCVVHQSTTYELKQRPDCELSCTKVQQWDGSCPVYGTCQWYCQTKRKDCTPGTRYHCARDLHNKDLFIETCAAEIFCLAGEEPYISLQQSGKASVYCRPCYRQNMYNGRHSTSSAVFSECPTLKTNLCVKTEHKVDCDKTSYLELTKTDGYCRCDARNGYAAQSEEMCFYQNKRCFKKKCPEGNVLSLNYTCVQECPVGFARSDESDICNTLKSPNPAIASEYTTFTTVVEDKDTHLSSEKPPNESRPNIRIFVVVIIGATLFIAALIVLVFVKQKKGKCLHLAPSYPGKSLRRVKQEIHVSEDMPLQTIELDEEKPEFLGLHSTISSEDKLEIVTGHFGKGVQDTDTETKIASGMSVDTETKIARGKSVDTETKTASRKAVYTETKIASGKSVVTETKIARGKSVDTETKIASGMTVDTETMIASSMSVDTEKEIASGTSVDTETNIASSMSVDTETKIASSKSVTALPRHREAQTARILQNVTATSSVATTKATTHDAQDPQEREVSADPSLRTNLKTQSTKSDSIVPPETDTTAAYMRSSNSQTRNYTHQDRCKEAYARLNNKEGFTFDEGFMYDLLKEKGVMELTDCDTIHSIDIAGFETYGIPGVETADLYLLISHMLCGNRNLKGTLQLAAARYGIQHFDTYLEELLKEFYQSKTPLIEARIFFELHGIYFNDFTSPLTEDSVSMALDSLFHQVAVTGSTGPFHATLLGGVLHCNITQHFENNHYHDRDVRTAAGFKVAFESSPSRSRELHIVWMKSANYPHRYCVIPAFKSDDTNFAKQTHIPHKHNEGMGKALIEKIKEQKPYKWRSCFEVLKQSQNVMFDDLKEMEFIRPDQIIRTINVPGYTAYTKPGEENTSMYEWLSLMLCGDKTLMYILRLAAARYAIKHFKTYVDKLNDEFNGVENRVLAAKVFFASHEIDFEGTINWRKNFRDCVSVAFRKLVNETVNEDKGNAPFYVEFLSGVLNRTIIQHFENNTFDGRVVKSICGLNVSLTTELSSNRELHMYWMKSSNQLTYQIVPLFPCNQKSNGKDLCGEVYKLLMGQVTFESESCLEMIDAPGIYVFEELKEHAILKPSTDAKRVIKTITIPGYIAFERRDGETTCLYEHTSRLLFGNTEKTFILRLAAIRYALQNCSKYVKQLADAFENSKSKIDAASTFFRIHCIDFKTTKKSPIIKDVGLAFVDLLRETVNTGQGPFYVEFLRGALNCKITQHFEKNRFYDWDVCAVPGLNVSLVTNTPPDRELHIYGMKTSRGRSYTYQQVSLVKNVETVRS